MDDKVTAAIGLGSNLESPADQVSRAIEALKGLPECSLTDVSKYYRSHAIGPGEQPDYCNAAVLLQTSLEPIDLLNELQAIEKRQGRRPTVRWGARIIDLDLLLYGDLQQYGLRLVVPHKHLLERDFVLIPLAEIASQMAIPGQGTVEQCLQNVLPSSVEPWDAD